MFFYFWRHYHKKLPTINPGWYFNNCNIGQLCSKLLNHSPTYILVGNFTSTENKGYLGLITLFEKTSYMLDLEIQVMVIGFRSDLDLFNLHLHLFLLGLLLFFVLLILELAIVHNSANRRIGGGGYLNQIQLACFCRLQCFTQGKNPQLFTIMTDNTYL